MGTISRRGFLFGTAAAAAVGCTTDAAARRRPAPGEKLKAAMIGCGIQMRTALIPQFLGKAGADGVGELVEIVATCDCDRVRAAAAAKQVNDAYGTQRCRAVHDFRDVLADDGIDIVCIATPDHWHAYMCVEAMTRGKDVYCEKPLTFSIDEAKAVMAAQKKYGRVFQTGSMQRSWREFRTACMIVRNGMIGELRYVDANYGRGGGAKLGGPSHPVRFFDDPANAVAEGAPNPDVDWNMWLGPARWRPYSDQLAPRGVNKFYPMFWRFDDDIGSGYNGDWGAHHLDIAQWGMDMDESGPKLIVRSDEPHSANPLHGGRRQYGMKMVFDGKDGEIELYHGPFACTDMAEGWGTVFYGTEGIVAVNRGRIAVWKGTGLVKPTLEIRQAVEKAEFMPGKIVAKWMGASYGTDATVKADAGLAAALDALDAAFRLADAKVQLYKSPNQVRNFVECALSRKPTISPAETGARGATLCLLCNMSYVYDTGFEWEPKRMELRGANSKGLATGRAVYRNGWEVSC